MGILRTLVSPILILLAAILIGVGIVILVKTFSRLKERKKSPPGKG